MKTVSATSITQYPPYKWGNRLLLAHLILIGWVLLNGLANYFQANSLDKYLKQLNVNASAAELHYLLDIIYVLGLAQGIYLVLMHLLAWYYTHQLVQQVQPISLTATDKLWVLLQPVYGLLKWWRNLEGKHALAEDRRPRPADFLVQLWGVIMTAVVFYYGAFFWWASVQEPTLEEGLLATMTYAHFALAAANFWFLLAAIIGWRAINRIQRKVRYELTGS